MKGKRRDDVTREGGRARKAFEVSAGRVLSQRHGADALEVEAVRSRFERRRVVMCAVPSQPGARSVGGSEGATPELSGPGRSGLRGRAAVGWCTRASRRSTDNCERSGRLVEVAAQARADGPGVFSGSGRPRGHRSEAVAGKQTGEEIGVNPPLASVWRTLALSSGRCADDKAHSTGPRGRVGGYGVGSSCR